MQDPTGNQIINTDDPTQPQSGAQLHRYQLDLAILESEYKKSQRRKEEIDLEIRELKKKKQQLDFEIADKEKELKNLESEMMMAEQEIHSLKKKIKLI